MLSNIGTFEVIVIAVVILLLFGASKLPEFARGIVNARKEFKENFKDDDSQDQKKDSN